MIRVLLVHDVGMLRSALAERLAGEPDLEVYDAPWRSAPGRARLLRPDVCAVDLDCSESYGIAPLGELPEGRTGTGRRPLLVLANANRPGPLRRAVEAHACGFVDNEGTPENLIAAIRKVAGGNVSSTTHWASAFCAHLRFR